MISKEPLELTEQGVSIRKNALAEVNREVGEEGGDPVAFRESDVAPPKRMDGRGEVGGIQGSSAD